MQNEKEKFKKDFIKRLIRLSIQVINYSEKLKKDRKLWPVIDQLVRSVTSVGANVVEAKSSSSKRDYIKYFEIALKSSNEAKYWLFLVKEVVSDNGLKNEAETYLKEVDEVSKILGSSVLTLKGKKSF